MNPAEEHPKILLVDDSSFIRWGLATALKKLGYDPVEAESGSDAIHKLNSVPNIRLVLLDVQMKGWSGFETLAEIRSSEKQAEFREMNNQWVPVVFVTSQDTEKDRLRGFELGATEFILKSDVRASLKKLTDKILRPSCEFHELGVQVVDDSMIIRYLIKSCLEPFGVSIFEAEDGAEALEQLKAHRDEIDVVVTDLQMPKMNGDVYCRTIRKELKLVDLPIIFLSSNDQAQKVLHIFQAGATDYIHKPFVREEMMARLEVHMRRQLLNTQLKANIAELKRLNQLKDKFLAVCSHDLRSPLSGMLGLTEILREAPDTTNTQREMLTHIRGAGEYLMSLINDILDLGRTQSDESNMAFEPVDLTEIIQSCRVTLQHTAGPKQVELTLDGPDGIIINGNDNALRRIFNNLISNAIKFTPSGGRVSVEIRPDQNGSVEVTVRDTGIGIPKKMLPHLFDEYSKTSRKGTAGEVGTALGMAITHRLVESHHGHIDVESVEDKGTAIKVSLPMLEEQIPREAVDAPVEQKIEEADAGAIRGLRVLVAEDNRVNQEYLKRCLSDWGCDYEIVEDGLRAVEAYVQGQDDNPFSIILMDIVMPKMDGLEAAREIRRLEEELNFEEGADHRILITALSAKTDEEARGEMLAAGMDGLVGKPIKKTELYQALRNAMDNGTEEDVGIYIG
ncbi:MAG: response regulator [Kiritimatiellae bacterium]|nr:response regulator [Kiritimatiellia bacterium]